METKTLEINIAEIAANPINPRKSFDPVSLGELADSIRKVGVLQPITVRPVPVGTEDGIKFQIVCGERRWRAAAMAGLTEIPSIIRDLTDDEAIDVAITENLQRKDVSPLEEAEAFKYLLNRGSAITDLCGRFGKSEFYVRGRLKLLSMSDDFRKLLDAGEISISQAMEVAKFDKEVQKEMFEQHFSQRCWNSWHQLNAKALYQKAIDSYTKTLDRYNFDKSDCDRCPNCSKNFSLFAAGEEPETCQDDACLQRKELEYQVGLALKIQKHHPEVDFYTLRDDCPKKSALEELGHDVKVLATLPQRIGAVITKELRKKVEEGKASLVIWLYGGDPYFGYVETSGIDPKEKDAVEELRKKDKRNMEIAEEKTVAEVRKAVSEMSFDMISAGELTEYESQLTLFVLLKNLKKEQQEKLGKINFYSMTDEEAWAVVEHVTPEQVAYIHRCTILNAVGDHFQRDFKTELFFSWVATRDMDIVPTAELKYKEVYLRRKEKIDARIAQIELSKEE